MNFGRADVVRRGPTIPIPFVLESDKRAAAAAQLRRMADVASVTEQPSTASALKRARTDDDQLVPSFCEHHDILLLTGFSIVVT